jgi:hypothetical protein
MISTITEIFDRRRSTFGGHGFCQAAGHPHANYSAATGYSQKNFNFCNASEFPSASVINPSFRVPSELLYKTSVVIDPIKYMLFFQSYL